LSTCAHVDDNASIAMCYDMLTCKEVQHAAGCTTMASVADTWGVRSLRGELAYLSMRASKILPAPA